MKLNHVCSTFIAMGLLGLTGCQNYSPTKTTWEVMIDPKYPERFTENFRGYQQSGFPAGAWVLDGKSIKTVEGQGGADIMMRQMYSNFELQFEWKTSLGGNSGVMYNVAETADPAFATGPEYQVLDDERHADGKNPKTSAGSLYALIAPNERKQLKPIGDYNRSKIIVNRGKVEHWLNGSRVVEYQWGSPEVADLIKRSKFAAMPKFMTKNHGYVVFQHHGEVVWYRNIRIRRL